MAAAVSLPAGTDLRLAPEDCLHVDRAMTLRVSRVLHELSRWYPDHVWVEGTRLEDHQWIQVLVRRCVLPLDLGQAGRHPTG